MKYLPMLLTGIMLIISCKSLICLSITTDSIIPERNKEKVKQSDRFMIAWGNDIWLGTPREVSVRSYSPSFFFSGMYDMPLGYSRFSIAAGLGIQSNNLYNVDAYINAYDYSGKMTFTPFPDSINVSRYKLNATYLELPFEFRWRLGENDKSTLAVGFKAGVIIHNKTKYKGDNFRWSNFPSSEEIKIKEYNIPALNNLKYAVTFRLTSNETKIGIFAEYNLKPLFEEGKLVDQNGDNLNMSLITTGLIVSIF